jgi:microcystin-dependent protein
MAFDFPASPVENQEFTPSGGPTYVYKAPRWIVKATVVGVPAGAIIFGVMVSTPNNFLLCNGAAVSRTTYADLFAAISTTFGSGDGSTTFNLPDLRGQFIRGVDGGRGLDPSRVAGSNQAAQFQSHAHTASSGTVSADHSHAININTGYESADHAHNTGTMYSRSDSGSPVAGTWALGGSNATYAAQNTSGRTAAHYHNVSGNTGGISANHTHAITVNATGTGTETRPTNIALHGYIRY